MKTENKITHIVQNCPTSPTCLKKQNFRILALSATEPPYLKIDAWCPLTAPKKPKNIFHKASGRPKSRTVIHVFKYISSSFQLRYWNENAIWELRLTQKTLQSWCPYQVKSAQIRTVQRPRCKAEINQTIYCIQPKKIMLPSTIESQHALHILKTISQRH